MLPENRGKGYAMATALQNARGDIIVFIDADLSNLQEGHFLKLITPVKNREADMVLGQATETLVNYRVNPFKSLSGQRCLLKKDIMPIVEKMKEARFGVETLINLYFQSAGKKVNILCFPGSGIQQSSTKRLLPKQWKNLLKKGIKLQLLHWKITI